MSVRTGARKGSAPREWISLTEACETLGVSASTLRRWADAGIVRTFVTPGGHRRFARAGVQALLPGRPGARPPLASLGETSGRVARAYRRAASHGPAMPWLADLDETHRERFRAHGRAIVDALLRALDAGDEEARQVIVAEAGVACTEYGRAAAAAGISAGQMTDVFLRFRRPFLDELGRLASRREFDAAATVRLTGDATLILDALLVATLQAYEAERSAGRHRPPTHTVAAREVVS